MYPSKITEIPLQTSIGKLAWVADKMDINSSAVIETEIGPCGISKKGYSSGPEVRVWVIDSDVKQDTEDLRNSPALEDGEIVSFIPDLNFYNSFGYLDAPRTMNVPIGVGTEDTPRAMNFPILFPIGVGTEDFPFLLTGKFPDWEITEMKEVLPHSFSQEYYRNNGIWIKAGLFLYHWDGKELTKKSSESKA